jgi:predicted SprT family Zn-dependent metalloprotease
MYLNPTSDTYENLLLAFKFMNEYLFGGTLPICLITLQREKKTFGYFCGNRFHKIDNENETTDEIALNPQYFRSEGRDDRMVVSTLVHEMCHLWQHHYGKPGRARYHNKEWADKMLSFGLIPSSTGLIGGLMTGDKVSHCIDEKGLFNRVFADLIVQGFVLQWIEPSSNSIQNDFIEKTGMDENNFPGPDDVDQKITTPISKKKIDTSKVKYSCPTCKLNAWAKMGVNLICGDCNEAMINDFT